MKDTMKAVRVHRLPAQVSASIATCWPARCSARTWTSRRSTSRVTRPPESRSLTRRRYGPRRGSTGGPPSRARR